jgi:hypothetical protein
MGKMREPVRSRRQRRTADARHVEDDGLHAFQRGDKRFDQFEIGANAVEY